MTKLKFKSKAKLIRLAVPMLQPLQKGDRVRWSGIESEDIYTIKGIQGNIVFLLNDEGNEVDAFNYEIEKV